MTSSSYSFGGPAGSSRTGGSDPYFVHGSSGMNLHASLASSGSFGFGMTPDGTKEIRSTMPQGFGIPHHGSPQGIPGPRSVGYMNSMPIPISGKSGPSRAQQSSAYVRANPHPPSYGGLTPTSLGGPPMDGFLNWDFDLEPPQYTDGNWSRAHEQDCPSCGHKIDLTTTSLHAHVANCFLKSKLSPGASAQEVDAEPIVENIHYVQKFISKMDLRTRLGMMESFYRLSKSQETGELPSSPHNPAVSPKAQAHDSCVLNLLYGKVTPDKTRTDPTSFQTLDHLFPVHQAPKVMGQFKNSSLAEFDVLHDHHGEVSDMLVPPFAEAHSHSFSFIDSGASLSAVTGSTAAHHHGHSL